MNFFHIVIFIASSLLINVSYGKLIHSKSQNLTIEQHQLVQLPCLVDSTENTIVIWQQCEDPLCNELRNPLTIGKDNFIQDLRFRLVYESNVNQSKFSNWMLEIRKFNKHDEACYECQLNTLEPNKIHYCLKLKPKVTISPEKFQPKLNQKVELECHYNQIVHYSRLNWYKNGLKIDDNYLPNIEIHKKHANESTIAYLNIHKFQQADVGSYSCKYGGISNASVEFKDENRKISQYAFIENSTYRTRISSFVLSLILVLFW